jgi:glucarate dehydratase
MTWNRRDLLRACAGGLGLYASRSSVGSNAGLPARGVSSLRIKALRVTPIALPDPPLLAASGCHGPYFLRNIVELETDAGITGIGETVGSRSVTEALERAAKVIVGRDAFAYRSFAREVFALGAGCYAGIELACLDALGRATKRRLCELLGGPVRPDVEFAAYLFFRYAADHPTILADTRIADSRGKGENALDSWGEVRTPDDMAELAARFRDRFGFRVFKLKAGVLKPDVELDTMHAMSRRLGPDALLRIDPNARWRTDTAVRIGRGLRDLNLEYYEDPVAGQPAMAEVRRTTGLRMSTNMCVTSFKHIPEALQLKPIDVLLADHHYFGGFAGCQALGPMAHAAGWTLSQHSNSHTGITMAAMIHLAASIPELTSASDTHYPWLIDAADIIGGPKLPLRGGRMAIPDGPGLGVNLDRDRLARAHEVYKKCGMTRRDDASLMRRVEPGWDGRLF